LNTALAISILLFSSFGTAFAQIPAFGEEWPVPSPPPGYSTWYAVALAAGYRATGPISVGGVPFFTKVLNRLLEEKNPFTFNDQPLYAQITVPAGVAVAWVMGIIEYHPPSYAIRYLLSGFPRYVGTAGSTTDVGPFPRGNVDPEGKYAWRIGMMALVCDAYGCRWYWSDSVQYYNFKQTDCGGGTVWDPTTNSCICPVGTQLDPISRTCNAIPTCTGGMILDPTTNTCICPYGMQLDPISRTCNAIPTCTGGMILDPTTNTCICPYGMQLDPNTRTCKPVPQVCSFGMEWDPTTNTCVLSSWVVVGVVVALVVVGIVAVFLLTRRRPSPPAAYKPYPEAPQPVTLKPAAPQAIKPGAHVPRIVGRREEKK
jgi:hypothetical protein